MSNLLSHLLTEIQTRHKDSKSSCGCHACLETGLVLVLKKFFQENPEEEELWSMSLLDHAHQDSVTRFLKALEHDASECLCTNCQNPFAFFTTHKEEQDAIRTYLTTHANMTHFRAVYRRQTQFALEVDTPNPHKGWRKKQHMLWKKHLKSFE
jgi:hypothetical protein